MVALSLGFPVLYVNIHSVSLSIVSTGTVSYRTVARKVSFAEQLDYDTRSFSRLQLYHDTQTMYSGTCSWLADWNYMCRRGIIFPNSKSECYPIAGFGERTHTSRDQRACHLAHRVYGIYPQDLA